MDNSLKSQQEQNIRPMITPRTFKYGLIYFSIAFIVMIVLAAFGIHNILSYPNIYAGIYINEVHVGGESQQSAIKKLKEKYQSGLDNKKIRITSMGKSKEIYYKEVNAAYDIEETVSQAFDIGRKDNWFRRLFTISKIKRNNIVIPLKIQVDQKKLKSHIKALANEVNIPVKEYRVTIEGDLLKVTNGTHGEVINIANAASQVLEAITSEIFPADTIYPDIEIFPERVDPKQVDVEKLYEHVCEEPADAHYEVKNYRINIIPHKEGKHFDKAEAKKIIEQHRLEGETFSIPLTITQPKITREALEKKLFKDQLSQYSTFYDINYYERSNNVELAANQINNVVLAPGDTFSYNEVVGERTPETGYKNAKIYVAGQIVDGIGGGICQVSSTLYNAVLFSDLEVVSRTNHSMTVKYVPFGQDAAVAYGIIDFKFKNSTQWPIRLIAKAQGGRLTFEIWGTSETVGKSVEIENVIIETIPFTVRYENDPNLEEGKTTIKQRGSNGYVVDTYKIIKQDGKEISKNLITRSRYRPIEQIEIKGTKKVEKKVKPIKEEQKMEPSKQPDQPQPSQPEETEQPAEQSQPVMNPEPLPEMPKTQDKHEGQSTEI
ncbi:MAG: hypothetical protein PWQ70_2824 [Clostridiales bacterium]|jgi:vancomycin resistance protein YoaR|nr:hypothetical protein [Clostridiales bacterium]